MHDNGTWHIHNVESGLYRLPCTSVFVTAQLTDVRNLVVLRMQEQFSSCWWHCYHWSASSGEETMPCLFETAVSHPLKCTSTTTDSIHCTYTESRHVRVVCESQQVEFRPIVICYSGEEKMSRLVSRLHNSPCCRWIHLLCMGTLKDATQYPLCVRANSVSVFLQPQIKYHIILGYGRGAMTMTLTGWYWSRWYILECHCNVCPAQNTQPELWKSNGLKQPDCHNHDITCHLADICCCITMLYDMCQI